MVSVSASVNLPLHHKVQKFSSGTGSPGWSRKRSVKQLWWWWWWVRVYCCNELMLVWGGQHSVCVCRSRPHKTVWQLMTRALHSNMWHTVSIHCMPAVTAVYSSRQLSLLCNTADVDSNWDGRHVCCATFYYRWRLCSISLLVYTAIVVILIFCNRSDVLAWLSVWSEVRMICIWSAEATATTPSSLDSLKTQLI